MSTDQYERPMFNIGRQGAAHIVSEFGMYTLLLRCRDAKEPVVISAGSYRHKRARALTDFARATVQISDLVEGGGVGGGRRALCFTTICRQGE